MEAGSAIIKSRDIQYTKGLSGTVFNIELLISRQPLFGLAEHLKREFGAFARVDNVNGR